MYEGKVIVDLTTQPVTISVDECPSILVVRSWAAFGVDGILTRRRKVHARAIKEIPEYLKPGAQLTQGGITCLETRVPLMGFEESEPEYCYHCQGQGCYRCARPKVQILADPWEVPTGSKDVLTGHTLTWRAHIQVFTHPKNRDLWIITVTREGESNPLVRVATKSLSVLPFKSEPLPLQRFAREVVASTTPTAWERLIEDD